MENDCEVVGWVLLDDAAHVLVRKDDVGKSPLSAEKAFEHIAIQSGSFRRKRIIDSVTRDVLAHNID